MIRSSRASALVVVAAAVAGSVSPASATSLPERTSMASGTTRGGTDPGQSTRPSLSQDGVRVAFDSTSPGLATDPNGEIRDVFLFDRATSSTRLVSSPGAGLGADGASDSAVISGSGRSVAFVSAATNLVSGDRNRRHDVFVRVGDAPPQRISVASATGKEVSGNSTQPDLSRTGSVAVFTSTAPDLVAGDTNALADVFAADLLTGDVHRVSQPASDAEPNGPSSDPAVSADGRFVSFTSDASNLVAGDDNGLPDVFLADRSTGRMQRVSVSSGEREQDRAISAPFAQVSDVSAGGRWVAFDSDATNLVGADRNRDTDVFVRDVRRGQTRRVSSTSTGREGTNDSFSPAITPSGRYVAFESFAEALTPGDAPGEDVFVHDSELEATSLVNVSARGGQPRSGEHVSQLLQRPALSDDAGVVAFSSTASNLVPGDHDGAEDVFLRSMAPPRGGFASILRRFASSSRPRVLLRADDPAARTFLCSVDGRRRLCGRRVRLPALAPGLHAFSVRAGGPGMLFSDQTSTWRFRVRP